MILAWLTLLDGIVALVLAVAGILCAHFNVTPPFHLAMSSALFGFSGLLLAFFLGILGIIIGRGRC